MVFEIILLENFAVLGREFVERLVEGCGEGLVSSRRGENLGELLSGEAAFIFAAIVDEGVEGDAGKPAPDVGVGLHGANGADGFDHCKGEDFAGLVFVAASDDQEITEEAVAVEIEEFAGGVFVGVGEGGGEGKDFGGKCKDGGARLR